MHPFFDLAFLHGGVVTAANFRRDLSDFQVSEQLEPELDGAGEHLWVRVRKRGMTTPELVNELARWAGVRPANIGFSGLKDKFAVTEQWLSIALPGRGDPPLPPSAQTENRWQILVQQRHRRKLKRGFHQANRFTIRLRELDGDHDQIEARLLVLKASGVPNYFGEQRFGSRGGNLEAARALFSGRKRAGRQLRGLLISAARSHLFNQVLQQRVRLGSWDQLLAGEVVMLAGTQSFFVVDAIADAERERFVSGDIHPSGPLWGQGVLPAVGDAGALELQIAEQLADLRDGLEHERLRHQRRRLKLELQSLRWRWLEEDLELEFELPTGCFATAVLRELTNWREE